MNMDNCDLFTEEARRSLTKYKVYKPKLATIRESPGIVREVKTTAKLATD